MRKLSILCLFVIPSLASSAMAQAPSPPAAVVQSDQKSLAVLQGRFANLQKVVQQNDEQFDLQLVSEGQTLLGQRPDGVIRLPADWVAASPDRETLDFLMLLALSDAVTREPTREGPSPTTKALTGAIALLALNVAKNQERSASRDPGLHIPRSRFASISTPEQRGTALRALGWAVRSGSCEEKIVAGLRQLGAVDGSIGVVSRQIVKDLGAVAWTPNRCEPPAN